MKLILKTSSDIFLLTGVLLFINKRFFKFHSNSFPLYVEKTLRFLFLFHSSN